MTLIVYAMMEMIGPSECNDKCKMCLSKYYPKKWEDNILKVAISYYFEPAYSPNNDP